MFERLHSLCIDILTAFSDFANTVIDYLTTPIGDLLDNTWIGGLANLVIPNDIELMSLLEFMFGVGIAFLIIKLIYNFIKP